MPLDAVESAPVLVSRAHGIAEIRLNRPAALNALDPATARAFLEAVQAVVGDASVRVIVLAGAGRAFAAGGDLAYFRNAPDPRCLAASALIRPMHYAIECLMHAPQPVLASLHGAVAGAGMSLALAADLAIAGETTRFDMAYVRIANSPDCGATWTLPRIVGLRKATEIALLGDKLDAAEALRLGLVNRVVPDAQLAQATREWAERLLASAPLALASTKRLLRGSLERPLAEQLAEEAKAFSINAGSRDFGEALDAFFSKRSPRFEGR